MEEKQTTETEEKQTFYITTAINYTNGLPHIGHAYEAMFTDILARFAKVAGKDVFFLTGTDEHGQKIAETAAAKGCTPKELCDNFVAEFEKLDRDLNIDYDRFIRTTDEDHIATCQWLWNVTVENGDIYLGHYEGWYNVREEQFVTELEAAENDYKDPASGKPLTKTSEPSYFFRMSNYQESLINHITENPRFIQPETLRAFILQRLEEPLRDLSVSRTSFDWGIEVPNDDDHVMYVWYDALTNYLSGVGYPNGELSQYWPADVHIIGKDIVWFHTVIWPCMLLSAGISLPKCIFGHGFILDKDGIKMSKSIGNVISPSTVLETYNSDTVRYFVAREAAGQDLKWNYDNLRARYDAELADNLGNLVSRVLNLGVKWFDGVPDGEIEPLYDLDELIENVTSHMENFQIYTAYGFVVDCAHKTNNYLATKEPWKIKTENALELQAPIVRTAMESVYILIHFFSAVIPEASARVFEHLQKEPVTLSELTWSNLEAGAPITKGPPLFPRFRENRFNQKNK
eukprot:TRINITY_DN3046_c0_g1_i1.p1 TRINITY_DN3046_c0_g1~~TRINITY_DN3046_c0_g1_i1.p1  ORF type:complete len:516 (-),score=111.59 TRINITY_DN3046_c0_g1_i1:53-1600(-)